MPNGPLNAVWRLGLLDEYGTEPTQRCSLPEPTHTRRLERLVVTAR